MKANPELRVYFELAEMMGCTVGELLDRMPASELPEWIAYWELKQKDIEKARKKKH